MKMSSIPELGRCIKVNFIMFYSVIFAISIALVDGNYFETISNNAPRLEGQDILTWCTTSILEQQKCEKLAVTVLQDKGLFGKDFIEITCKRAFDTEECMSMVDRGQASLLALDAGEVYVAGRFHSLVPIAQELYGRAQAYQRAVAVARRGALPAVRAGAGLGGLRGARACFPAVGALAGWVMPIHVLMQEGGLKVTDCNNHVKSATAFFGDSCAPNSLKNMYNPIGDNSDQLCRLCVGAAGVRCTPRDPHAGYEGALRCLVAGGDVAFVRDTAVQHALLAGKIDGVSPGDYELICRDGSRRPVAQWEDCHWGLAPADAVVASSARAPHLRARYQNILRTMIQLYGQPNPYNKQSNTTDRPTNLDVYGDPTRSAGPRSPYDPYRGTEFGREPIDQEDNELDGISTAAPFRARSDAGGRPIDPPFQLFRSNGTTDLLLQDATVNFRFLPEDEQLAIHIIHNRWVGEQALNAVRGIRACPIARASLCVTSDAEMEKCIQMRVALKTAFLSPSLVCWRAHSTRHCERAIADGSADFALLDAGDMLHAAAAHRLVPFMQEVYSSGDSHYYAVAVAKEADPDTDLTYLRGKRTCHTGVGAAAGWIYPLAYLISNGWIRSYGCDGAHAASQYFAKSCAPGALSGEYVDAGTAPHENLCHLCHGENYRRCRRDASEPYYGHLGALRCMAEGGGHVAFVRHTAPHEASGGRRREWWARDLLAHDLQLLCVDGTRARIHEYASCNLGRVPGAVLAGRANHTELDAFAGLMLYTQQLYGATRDDYSFSMFYSQPPHTDLIFSDVAVRLRPLAHSERSADIIAGPALARAARIVSCDAPQSAYLLASDPEFLSGANVQGPLLTVVLLVAAVGAMVG